MKKYLAVFIMILICLLLPMQIRASQSEIGTTVPETHTVSIEAEHASARYVEGDKGISDAYPVPRFSKTKFEITAEDGYVIKRVLLNGKDVTKRLKNGTLKLSKVYENQVITVETEVISQKPQTPQTQQPQVQQTSQAEKTQQTPKALQKQNTGKNIEQKQESTETTDQKQQDITETTDQEQESGNEMAESISQGEIDTMDGANTENETEVSARHFSFWWILLLLLTAGIIIWLIILLKKRKNNKNEEKIT